MAQSVRCSSRKLHQKQNMLLIPSLLFIALGFSLGLWASLLAGRDAQTYAAPDVAKPALKFVPCSLSTPKN